MATRNTTKEIWKPVQEFDGLYAVSSLGRVYSLDRWVRSGRSATEMVIRKGRILRANNDGRGYLVVGMRDRNGQGFTRRVHILVIEAFVGPRPDGMFCNHIDFNTTNNEISNLEWCTPSQNTQHSVSAGRMGTKKTVLTREIIVEAYALWMGGMNICRIARLLGVNRAPLSAALNGTTWKHVYRELHVA